MTNTRHGDVGGLDDGRSAHDVGRGARRGRDARSGVDVRRRAGEPRLRYFSGCGDFLAHVKPQAVKIVGPYGLGYGGGVALAEARAAAPVAGVDYSTTNVQEQGVDEPDIVKTDGEKIVAIANGKLRVVVLGKDKPDLEASLAIEGAGAAAPAQEPCRRRVAHVRRRPPTPRRHEADRAGADADRFHRGRPQHPEPARAW